MMFLDANGMYGFLEILYILKREKYFFFDIFRMAGCKKEDPQPSTSGTSKEK